MKRLISLVVLIFCSLIAYNNSFAETQTWRLTNNTASDIQPRIIIDKQNGVWVEWLSNILGSYDVYFMRYNGSWSVSDWLPNDGCDQISCDITCNMVTGTVWTAWDSAGKIQYAKYYNGWWYGIYTAIDSLFTFPQFSTLGRISMVAGDSGTKFLSWVANDTTGYHSVYVMRCDSLQWEDPQCVMQGIGASMLYDDVFYPVGMAVYHQRPAILSYEVSWSMGGFFGSNLYANPCSSDNNWMCINISPNGYSFKHVGIGYDAFGNLLVVFCDSIIDGYGVLKCKKYSSGVFEYLDTYILQTNAKVITGSMNKVLPPVAVWSDGQKIYASAFYDSIWSAVPVIASDSSLTNCINPDIAVQNDSIMWVCYQSDGDIYVTKTSVPLGVLGRPEEINKPRVFSVKTWPNPAKNKVNILCSGLNNKTTKANIYNITGQLVKSIDIKENQTVWNCTDQDGKKVSSGIYILNVLSGEENRIQKISILK